MFDRDKFKALVHYVCWRCANDPSKLGAVKLNKVLWFSDVFSFAQTGSSITDARYVKQPFGPVPKPIVPVLRDLEQEGAIRIDEVSYFGHTKKQYVALRAPSMSRFTEDEVHLIDGVIKAVCEQHTATSISERTHDAIWKLAEVGETMPFNAILASELGTVTSADIARAHDRMQAFA